MSVLRTDPRPRVYQKWLASLQMRAGALPQNNSKPRLDTKRVTLVKILRSLKGIAAGGFCECSLRGCTSIRLTPAMTSNVAPSGQVQMSSSPVSANAPYLAFDQNINTSWEVDTAIANLPQYIEYIFGSQQTVGAYSVTNSAVAGGVVDPSAWTLAGSNDGATFTTLDTQTGIAFSGPNTVQKFTIASPGSYAYYRLTVTAEFQPSENGFYISEIGLLTC